MLLDVETECKVMFIRDFNDLNSVSCVCLLDQERYITKDQNKWSKLNIKSIF